MRVVRWMWLAGALLGAACGVEGTEVAPVERPAVQALGSTPAAPAAAPARARPRAPRMTSEQLVEKLRARLSRPEGGLRVQTGRDGSHRIALDGHLQHATIAVIGLDGRVHTTCVDSPEAAAHALSGAARGAD